MRKVENGFELVLGRLLVVYRLSCTKLLGRLQYVCINMCAWGRNCQPVTGRAYGRRLGRAGRNDLEAGCFGKLG